MLHLIAQSDPGGAICSIAIPIAILFIRLVLWSSRSGSSDGSSGDSSLELARKGKGVSLQLVRDVFASPEGSHLPIWRIQATGALVVSRDNCPVTIRTFIEDLSEPREGPKPVFCRIESMADEHGAFLCQQEITIPHANSSFTSLDLLSVPVFACDFAKRGKRTLRITVTFADKDDPSRTFAKAEIMHTHSHQRVGYLELSQHRRAQDRELARLAFSLCADHGVVDDKETAVIKSFFLEQVPPDDEASKRRQEITESIDALVVEFKTGSHAQADIMTKVCETIRGDEDPSLSQAAYELCVRVVAADERVDDSEKAALTSIREQLKLPTEFATEVHDRYLRAAMYHDAQDANLISMPEGLTVEQKREFLNGEFRKWRGRVTHADPSVVADATLRLERITRMRRELGDG